MPLTHITLTGVEASVPLDAIGALLDDSSALELGVLYRSTKQGQGRYPTHRWICSLLDTVQGKRLALHVCGDAAYELLACAGMSRNASDLLAHAGPLGTLLPEFGRVQLNIDASRAPTLAQDARALCAAFPDTIFVTQHNDVNACLTTALASVQNHQILFDASLGRGQVPDAFPTPIAGKVCGYAGGLGPQNLSALLPRIAAAAGTADYWVDMESAVRSPDDCFSLLKARDVLRQCAPLVGAG